MRDNGQLCVMVVEDHEDTAESLSLLLQMTGHRVELAGDGETALSKARAEPPDVVLLDIGLPGMNGWEVARRMQELPGPKRPLLVAVSGYGQEDDHHRSQDAGIDLHLVKPVEPALLQGVLARFHRLLTDY